jgi:MYXO-CTERM domain-containing protein
VHALVLAAVISTLPLEGDVTAEGGDYVRVPFEVPEGTVEILFHHTFDPAGGDVLDFGLEDPAGQRGWCGGLTDDDVIGVDESSRCYLPGPIEPGTWFVDIGKARLESDSVHYDITLEFRDAAELAPRPRAEFEPRVLENGARWYAGDFHVHSSESGDATATFDQIRDLARVRGIDFVNLSDHNTVSQHALVSAYQEGVDDVLFLRGSEVTTYGGHGNTVGNRSYIEHHIGRDGHSIQALLDRVEDDGALFIVNHPKLDIGNCIGCGWSYEDTPWDKVTAIELHTGTYLAVTAFTQRVLVMWDDLLDQGHRLTGTGGSDDHRAPLEPEDGADSQIGTPTTVVWAEELSEAAIMEGVRAGRVVLKLRGPDDPMVELTAETDRDERGMIGDTLTGGRVALEAVVTGGDGMSLALVRNGEVDETVEVEGNEFAHTFERDTREEGDRYRVHLLQSAEVVITNHVWIEFAPPIGGGPDAGTGGGDGGGCGCRAGASGSSKGRSGAMVAVFVLAAFAGLRRRRSRR